MSALDMGYNASAYADGGCAARLAAFSGGAAEMAISANAYTHTLDIDAVGGTDTAAIGTNASGDLLIAVIGANDDHASITDEIASGWTLLVREKNSGGDDYTVSVWWKYSTGSEATVTIVNNDTTIARRFAVNVMTITGGHATVPIDATTVLVEEQNTVIPNPGAITTTVDNCLVVTACYHTQQGITLEGAPDGYTLQPTTAIGGIDDMPAAYKVKATAGAEDPGAFTNSGSTAGECITFTLSLAPAG